MLRDRWDSLDIVTQMLDAHVRYRTFLCGVEQGHLSMAISPMLNAVIAERKLYDFALNELAPGRRDKESRARSLQGRMRQGLVYLPMHAPWVDEFIAELQQFPHGRNDDQVDAASYLALMLDQVPTPAEQTTQHTPAWLTKLLSAVGRATGHMTA